MTRPTDDAIQAEIDALDSIVRDTGPIVGFLAVTRHAACKAAEALRWGMGIDSYAPSDRLRDEDRSERSEKGRGR